MRPRTMIALRRALILIAFFMIGIATLATNSPLVMLSAIPVVLLVFTDLCKKCGNVLFFVRGRSFWEWMNPLYVPKNCPKCGNEL